MKAEVIAFIVACTISIITVAVGVTYYNIKRDEAMKSNIESAIVKGIDPVAVKCAYGHSDPVCVVYVANKK
jgi:hypothetical protein